MSRSLSRSSTLSTMRSTIWMMSSSVSWWKTTVSSTRLRNSGRKCCLRLFVDLRLHPVVRALGVTLRREAQVEPLGDVPGPEVGRHDDDRVLEVHDPALGVGQATVLQDLEKGIEDIGVGLLDLVEEDDGERLPAHLLGELAALFVTHVTGGEPKRRETVCFSLNSDMSSAISASSSPKRNSASVLDSSVLPTPDGPAKMNEPPGRFGSFRPARVRRIACESALMASFWPMTRLWARPPCAAAARTPLR